MVSTMLGGRLTVAYPIRAFWQPLWSARNVIAMSKYDPLLQHLAKSKALFLTLSFVEIERILGASLPSSAHRHQAWWANEEAGRHIQSNSWMDAGFRTESLDLNARRVSFRKIN